MKMRKFWTTDKILSLAAIFISFITLYIFIRQTNIMERQSHLSVMPYLLIETSENRGNQTYSVDLVNHGVGPAIIDQVVIRYKGREYRQQLMDFFRAELEGMDSVEAVNTTTILKGSAIRSGDGINVLTIGGGSRSFTDFAKAMKQLTGRKFNYEVQYRSIYGHRWKINGAVDEKTQMPEPLDDQ